MMNNTMILLGMAAAFAATPLLYGAEGKSTLEQLRLGEHWYGAEITKEDLAGKVVLFEVWGS